MTSSTKPVALMTGATSGIGAAIARRLTADGFAVVLHSRSSAEAGRAMAAAMTNAIYIQTDLADEAARVQLIDQAAAQWGRLDIIVKNAGVSRVFPTAICRRDAGNLARIARGERDRAMASDHAGKAAVAPKRASPCIINIAAHAGVRPKGASIPYAVSKVGLVHMTKLLAVSLAPAVRVNAIAPGLVDTPMTANWAAAQTLWRERAPMHRAARPEDIADVAAMLVSSKYLTGEIVMADGGLNLT